MTIRVVLVDDQALVRVGLRTLFASEPDIEVVGEAAGDIEALAVVAHTRPDVVLCDIRMPTPNGLEVLRRITADLLCEMSAS